ncbi:hypothetical protein XENOCAPTIV_019821 [Xenoophorus captivus]|uniref:Groucho/TLE N-terminal Q-rich domain-containing protein n=1 Tax=Xenoophorus captivus TaxID=1517983 RepID=A0ABV0RSR2_9TELE
MSSEVVEIDTLSSIFSLKVEYDKLANEKTEMQRHYVMAIVITYMWWLERAGCQVWACENPQGGGGKEEGFGGASCYGRALPDMQWASL